MGCSAAKPTENMHRRNRGREAGPIKNGASSSAAIRQCRWDATGVIERTLLRMADRENALHHRARVARFVVGFALVATSNECCALVGFSPRSRCKRNSLDCADANLGLRCWDSLGLIPAPTKAIKIRGFAAKCKCSAPLSRTQCLFVSY